MFARFTWFLFDPTLFHDDAASRWAKAERLAHDWPAWAQLSRACHAQFAAGDESAIFAFARRSNAVLLAPWVLTVLRRWQAEGTPESRQKIRQFISRWVDARGKERPHALLHRIRRDMALEAAVLTAILAGRTHEQAVAEVAGAHHMSEDTVHEIHREYWKYRDLFRGRGDDPRPAAGLRHYLQHIDPDPIWARVRDNIDDEATAFFLDLELKWMTRTQRIRLDELHPTEWSATAFFAAFCRGLQDGDRVELRVLRRNLPDDGFAGGACVRVELVPMAGTSTPARTVVFEWDTHLESFQEVPAVNSDAYRALKRQLK